MALFDMIDALRDSGLTSILPIPLWVSACPGWDSCSWPELGQIALWFTPRYGTQFDFCMYLLREV